MLFYSFKLNGLCCLVRYIYGVVGCALNPILTHFLKSANMGLFTINKLINTKDNIHFIIFKYVIYQKKLFDTGKQFFFYNLLSFNKVLRDEVFYQARRIASWLERYNLLLIRISRLLQVTLFTTFYSQRFIHNVSLLLNSLNNHCS